MTDDQTQAIAALPDFPRDSRHCSVCGNCRTAPCERPDCGIRPAAYIPGLVGAIARGWCTPENSHKVMDEQLTFAIAREVKALLATTPAAADDKPVAIVTGSSVQWLPGADKVPDRAPLYTRPAAASGEAVHFIRHPTAKDIHAWDEVRAEQFQRFVDAGFVARTLYTHPAPEVAGEDYEDCPTCKGSCVLGEQRGVRCSTCSGTGSVLATHAAPPAPTGEAVQPDAAAGGLSYALRALTDWSEAAAVKIEGEFGLGRSLEEIIAAGDLAEEITNARTLLDGPAATPALLGLRGSDFQTMKACVRALENEQHAMLAEELDAIIAALKGGA